MDAAHSPTPPPHVPDGAAHPMPTTALFAQRMAHDLNNFATVMRTYGELLLSDLPEGDTRSDVAEIHHAAEAMVAYVQQVTQFARTSGMRVSAVEVADMVRAAADEFAEARDQAAVSVGTLSARRVLVDPTWLRQSLHAIITNAREVAPPTTPITISATDEQDRDGHAWVRIAVVDQGPGFAPSVSATAEDPYVTTKMGVRGAGFGLTLAATCAAMSGGRLERTRVGDTTCVALLLRANG